MRIIRGQKWYQLIGLPLKMFGRRAIFKFLFWRHLVVSIFLKSWHFTVNLYSDMLMDFIIIQGPWDNAVVHFTDDSWRVAVNF